MIDTTITEAIICFCGGRVWSGVARKVGVNELVDKSGLVSGNQSRGVGQKTAEIVSVLYII